MPESGVEFWSLVLSVFAIALSSLTTYLTAFNARYALTATVARLTSQVQTSSSRNAGEPVRATYQTYVAPSIILSLRGTRPVVVTEIALQPRKRRAGADRGAEGRIQPFNAPSSILCEPGSVQEVSLEFGLPALHNDFERRSDEWDLVYSVIDHAGRRRDASIRFLRAAFELVPDPAAPEAAPTLDAKIDYERKAARVAASGWLVNVM